MIIAAGAGSSDKASVITGVIKGNKYWRRKRTIHLLEHLWKVWSVELRIMLSALCFGFWVKTMICKWPYGAWSPRNQIGTMETVSWTIMPSLGLRKMDIYVEELEQALNVYLSYGAIGNWEREDLYIFLLSIGCKEEESWDTGASWSPSLRPWWYSDGVPDKNQFQIEGPCDDSFLISPSVYEMHGTGRGPGTVCWLDRSCQNL